MATDEPTQVLALAAAHPMDTHWFAVDELGQIAMFRAGEVGPIPAAAAQHWPRGSTIANDLVPLLGELEPEVLSYEAADVFAIRDASGEPGWFARLGLSLLDAPPRFDQSLTGVLLQLSARSGARERFAGLGLHVLPSREGGYAWGDVDTETLRLLWREGWIVRACLGYEIEPTCMGMFLFEHEWSAIEDEYARWYVPRVPVRVHALPTSLRCRLAAAQFPGVDFRQHDKLRVSRAVAAESG